MLPKSATILIQIVGCNIKTMYNPNNIFNWFLAFWFISFPLSIWIVYTLVTEFLDLILNTGKINKLLRHSDNIRLDLIEKYYKKNIEEQSTLDDSNRNEVKRQIKYSKIRNQRNVRGNYSISLENRKIIAAKKLSDIFRIN